MCQHYTFTQNLFTTHTYLTFAFSLINTDGRNAALDPCWGRVIHQTLPSPSRPYIQEGSGNQTKIYMLSVRVFNQFTPLTHVWVTPPGWQEVVQAMENSSYFESLEAKAKGKVPWKAVLRRFIYLRRPLSAEKRCQSYGHLATDTFFRWERLASAIKTMVVSFCTYGVITCNNRFGER